MVGYVAHNWPEINGQLLRDNIDLLDCDISTFCDIATALVYEGLDSKGREKLTRELNRPLPGEDPDNVNDGAWDDDVIASEWASASNSIGQFQ